MLKPQAETMSSHQDYIIKFYECCKSRTRNYGGVLWEVGDALERGKEGRSLAPTRDLSLSSFMNLSYISLVMLNQSLNCIILTYFYLLAYFYLGTYYL